MLETVTDRDYGIGKPLEMVMPDPSKVGSEGSKVLQKGMKPSYDPLSPIEEATFKQAVENSFMFLQVSGVKGDSPTGDTSEVSFGLPWDRQSPMEVCAESIARRIGGSNQIHWFSPHKLLVFIEEDQTPEEMLRRMVEAPREPYQQELPHLARALNKLQDIRDEELLQNGENGRNFVDIFNGERDPLQRAYQDNGRFCFVWGCQNREGRLWGMNLENQPQAISDLAIDDETKSLIREKERFLTTVQGTNRYVVQIDFSATVSCCNISFNAQQNTISSMQEIGTLSLNRGSDFQGITKIHSANEIYSPNNYCQKHQKSKNECDCKDDEKLLAA